MSFLKKKKMRHGPEPAEELFVRVHVGEGEPQFDRVFVLPASHLTRPRLAPLVAMAEEDHQGGVVRIKCRLSDFAEALALTVVEEAGEGRTACGWVEPPSDAGAHHLHPREAMLRWMLDPASCDPSILEKALTGNSADLRAAADVISSRTPSELQILRQKYKRTSSPEAMPTRSRKTKPVPAVPTKSLASRISERLRDYVATHKPSPQMTPPPCDISFRPTWARNRRTSVSSSEL